MKISLADYVGEVGQAKADDAIGVHQTAISKAIRVGRKIFVNTLPDGKIKAEEIKPFPYSKNPD
ncbi:Cro/CI family transcriptional regulator [Klebsiella grimontii]|uniref:Cro/CI family transcriptional regulator n=1 Tax=Klebsiella grimontii TaxID=2058152 RepID=UPI000DD3F647|nr:Cro/CI family transcriptional regulator [Klebsiella grimontii]